MARGRGADREVELRAGEPGTPVRMPTDIDDEADFWTFVVAERDWWTRAEQRRAYLASLARGTLEQTLGFAADVLDDTGLALADALLLEVVVPARPALDGIRELPWEYLLTAATAPAEGTAAAPPTVIRTIEADSPAPRPRARRRVLYVESLPGELADTFTFETERELPAHLDPAEEWELVNPSLADLRTEVRRLAPDVIHLAGCDSHHAAWQIHGTPDDVEDGMALADASGDVAYVSAADLAAALCAAGRKPELVVFNLYNSAAHLGAETVAAGAGAALGFQHRVDDAVAELLIAELYRMLGARHLPLVPALIAARKRVKSYAESMHGSGFVLWSRGTRAHEVDAEDMERMEAALTDVAVATLDPARAGNAIRYDIEPYRRINYALLHNQRPLFQRFEIRKIPDEVLRGVAIESVLQVGSQTYRAELLADLPSRVNDFRDRIRVPLTWALDELPVERVQTTLTTRVRHEGRDLFVQSEPVHLQPVDVWVDDDVNRQWLPSFVLPRDPAVRKVIAAAQRYLVALADDVTAGFDGYQSVDLEAAEPFARVDAQVAALWTALVQDFGLRYINPPPSFELMSQRLRSPSDVLAAGRGTCIDLALLIAACLEHIEIYPAVFLLDGHAFVGYWRSAEGYDDFIDQALLLPGADPDLDPDHGKRAWERRSRFGAEQPRVLYPWVYGRDFYRPVFNAVQRRQQLVPLEATGIPSLLGFWEAVDEGTENLRSPHDFHSVVDVPAARDHGVTPLPFARAAP